VREKGGDCGGDPGFLAIGKTPREEGVVLVVVAVVGKECDGRQRNISLGSTFALV